MYQLVVFLHSILRWAVLAAGVALCVRCFVAWRRGRAWEHPDERLHVALIRLVDVQLLLGLVLYVFLSPVTELFRANLRAGMKDSQLRFYGVEHLIVMLVAVALLHVGRARSKRAKTDRLRHRRAWVMTLVALLLMLASIPWPGLPHGRPLLRGWAASSPASSALQLDC